jgi:hypothetical protein
MSNNEAIIMMIFFFYLVKDLIPVSRPDVGAVNIGNKFNVIVSNGA